MGWVKSGSWSRRWSRKASRWLCVLALAGLPAWGQTLPQPPYDSDLAFRVTPTAYDSLRMSPEVLQEQPLVRLIEEAAVSLFGFDMIDDLGQAFEGTMVGAVLADSESNISLVEYFEDQEIRSEHQGMIEQLRSLVTDLETYKSENDSYPEDFRKYIDEVRYFDVYLMDGASYEYERTDNGQGFRLVVSYAPSCPLSRLGPPPILGSEGLEENTTPEGEPLMVDLVFAAKVRNAELAKKIVTKLMGEPAGGIWVAGPEPAAVATMRGPWLVVSNRKSHLGPFLKTLNGKAPGLAKNPRYELVARNIDMNAPGMFYADVPHILEGLDMSGAPEAVEVLQMIGPAGYSITPRERSQLSIEVFMGVNAPQGSELEKVMAESAQAQTEAAMVASNIPWDVSNVIAIDYRRCKRLLNALVALSPDAEQSMDTAEDVWAGFLGLDAEAGFDHLVDGWVIVSFERLDIFVNAFEGFVDTMKGFELPSDHEETGGPPEEDSEAVIEYSDPEENSSEDSEAELSQGQSEQPELAVAQAPEPEQASPEETGLDEPVEVEVEIETELETEPEVELSPRPAQPPRVPFTAAFRVSNEQARGALLEALQKQLGEESKTTTMSGVDVVGRKDGLLSYALRDDWFYIAGGNTQRLLRNLLAAATGRKPTLTSLSTWARFRAGKRGEVLAIGHQKVDALYSMVKGALLLMGPDFRPLADELGGLRDYHSAAFLVPDGLLFVGDILQGNGE